MSRLAEWLATWWWRDRPGPLALLTPLACVFATLTAVRRRAWGRAAAAPTDGPVVIAVGNLVVGGGGKTPVTAAIVRALAAAGWRPGIVTRGYPVSPPRPVSVTATSSPDDVGDEALIHAMSAPVVVCRERTAAVAQLRCEHPEIDVIVADDALQHYALRRDLEVEVVSAGRGYGNRRLLPVGPLREPLSRAEGLPLRLVLADPDEVVPASLAARSIARRRLDPPKHLLSGRDSAWADWQSRRVSLVAGIADPAQFARSLACHRVEGVLHAFPDHHRFSAADLAGLSADPILMTTKDAVKLRGWADDRLWVVGMTVELPTEFVATLTAMTEAARRQRTTVRRACES